MEFVTGIALLILFPIILYARQQVDAAAKTRRRGDEDHACAGADIVIDPSTCDSGAADGGSGCGGGCGGCGS